jgi:large subunit ribosomal protein L10
MPRPEKVQAVAEIKERLEGAKAVFLAEYAGLSVKDQQTLRRALKKGGAEFKVVKMSLARRAAGDLDLETLDDLLLGPTGLAFADEDAVAAAKALKDFAKDHEVFIIKGGLLGGDFLTPERVAELADIEPREVLLAKFAGAAKAPLANFAGLLAALPRNLASMLQQVIESREEDAPATNDEGEPAGEIEEAPVPDDAAAEEPPEAIADDPTADDQAEPVDEAEPAEGPTAGDDADETEDQIDEQTDDETADEAEEE